MCGVGPELFQEFTQPAESFEPADPTPVEVDHRLVIIGAGVAGVTAAQYARATSPNTVITLISREPGLPYQRLNLTRYLANQVERGALPLHEQHWYFDNRVGLLHGEVAEIRLEDRVVRLTDGQSLVYERLLLANGAHPFVPPIPGVTRDGVFSLRTQQDVDALVQRTVGVTPAACVIGGGLLGLETAGALQARGLAVTVLEGFSWLLPRQLAEPAGRLLQRHLQRLGIAVRCGVRVEQVLGDEGARGVSLEGGEELPAELVVVAAGVRPNSYLARLAGLNVDRGVLVDDQLVTSDPNVLAAGDVAQHRDVVYGLWPAALAQGAVAGTNAAGGSATFAGLSPSTMLKVLDVDTFSVGQISATDGSFDVFEQLDRDAGTYRRLVCQDGRLVGANLYGDTRLSSLLKSAVDSGAQVSEQPLLLEQAPELAARQTTSATKGAPKMASLKGTQTEKNLLAAFAGESQARNRYTYAAGVARKAGLLQIAELFVETADNEKEHAKRFFKFLEGGELELTASYPAGTIADTAGNLLAAAQGEHEEWSELYPAFAATAKEEGFDEVAAAFTMIARAERAHEERFRKLLASVEADQVFSREQSVEWKCRNCGYVHEGAEAPGTCPACLHPQSYFEQRAENY